METRPLPQAVLTADASSVVAFNCNRYDYCKAMAAGFHIVKDRRPSFCFN
jgi:hypothetical protein